jgi:hypothetical protein
VLKSNLFSIHPTPTPFSSLTRKLKNSQPSPSDSGKTLNRIIICWLLLSCGIVQSADTTGLAGVAGGVLMAGLAAVSPAVAPYMPFVPLVVGMCSAAESIATHGIRMNSDDEVVKFLEDQRKLLEKFEGPLTLPFLFRSFVMLKFSFSSL